MNTSHAHKFENDSNDTPCTKCGKTWNQITSAPAIKRRERDMTPSTIESRRVDAQFAARARWR